jgi:hypothetical protein
VGKPLRLFEPLLLAYEVTSEVLALIAWACKGSRMLATDHRAHRGQSSFLKSVRVTFLLALPGANGRKTIACTTEML